MISAVRGGDHGADIPRLGLGDKVAGYLSKVGGVDRAFVRGGVDLQIHVQIIHRGAETGNESKK